MSIELDPITSGFNLSKINDNFDKVENELNNNVLRRNGLALGEPNQMEVNLDMNSHSILNAVTDLNDEGSLVTVKDFNRTVRVPVGESILEAPSLPNRQGKVAAWDTVNGNPIAVAPISTPSDLAVALASSNGATLVGYRFSDVYSVLSRIQTVSDQGATGTGYLGRNPIEDALIQDSQTGDQELLHRGGLHLSKRLYGIRRNSTVLSINANRNGFQPEVTGVLDAKGIAAYQGTDDLAVYTQMDARILSAAELVVSATYTSTSMTPVDPASVEAVSVGSVIKTNHGTPFYGIVTSKTATTINVDMWADSGTTTGTPANGVGATLNWYTKPFAQNVNLAVPAASLATKFAVCEYGIINNKLSSGERTGLDMVVLPTSTFGADAAYIARSAKAGIGFNTGFLARGVSNTGFGAVTGTSGLSPEYAFLEDSGARYGIFFNGRSSGKTTYSMLWRFSNSSTVEPSALNPYGFTVRGGSVTASAPSTVALTLNNGAYYVNNSAPFSLVLPGTDLVNGQTLKFYFSGTALVSITTNGGANVNGVATYSHTPTQSFTVAEAVWNGSQWGFFR